MFPATSNVKSPDVFVILPVTFMPVPVISNLLPALALGVNSKVLAA